MSVCLFSETPFESLLTSYEKITRMSKVVSLDGEYLYGLDKRKALPVEVALVAQNFEFAYVCRLEADLCWPVDEKTKKPVKKCSRRSVARAFHEY